jgi:uncharacterized protein involved in exopolysaccharide biosynthesis
MTGSKIKGSLKVNLGFLLAVPLKRARIIGIIASICAAATGLALVVSTRMPPSKSWLPDRYTATASVLVRSENTGRLFSALATSEYAGALELSGKPLVGFSGEAAALFAMSTDSIRAVSEKLKLAKSFGLPADSEPAVVRKVLDGLQVGFVLPASVININYTDIDPRRAEQVVRSIMETMIERSKIVDAERAIGISRLLDTRIVSVQNEIEKSEKSLDAFVAEHGIFPGRTIPREKALELTRKRANLALLELQIEEYKKNSKLEDLILLSLRDRRNEVVFSIRTLEHDLDQLVDGDSKLAAEYAALERELIEKRMLLEILGEQANLVRLNALGQNTMFYIMNEPQVPETPSEPNRLKLWLIASAQGLIFAILLAYALEFAILIAALPEVAAVLDKRRPRKPRADIK